jgi:hypothetical protein
LAEILTAAGIRHTFDIVHLNDMLVYGIMKVRLFPSQTNLTRCNLLKGHLWGRRNVETQLLHQDIIWGLADLPCSVQEPEFQFAATVSPELKYSERVGYSPDEGPQDRDGKKQSHEASHLHSRDNSWIGIEGEIEWLIHPSVSHPWTRAARTKERW